MTKVGKIELNNGQKMPRFGFGTWQIVLNPRKKVLQAIEAGYRLIDTAKIYGNETGVGAAIRDSGLDRKELFVTTKLWNGDQGYEKALKAFDQSLVRLGLDYVDLYLIHWPGHDAAKRKQSWKALQEIYGEGSAKAIGVSNYEVEHLKELLVDAKVKPAVNQIEFHPYVYGEQKPILEFCKHHGIVVEAYSPLAHGKHSNESIIKEIAAKHKASLEQIMLAWCLHHGTVPIPKSTHQDRMLQNLDSINIKLSEKEIDQINNLSRKESVIFSNR